MGADIPALPRSTETTVDLVVDGKIVRSATGQNSPHLQWVAWNVAEFGGRAAQIQIIDKNTGGQGWGHLYAGSIVFSDAPKQIADCIDHGRDFYAVNSWNNVPGNERRSIGWMKNWDYGTSIPTSPWRSAQSIPREISLRTFEGSLQLIQTPIPELRELRQGDSYDLRLISIGPDTLPTKGKAMEIVAEFETGTATEFGLKVRVGQGEETLIAYDMPAGEIFVDRTKSGHVAFSNLFSSRETAPMPTKNGRVELHVFVDWSSVEAFGSDGQTVITDQIFPNPNNDGLALFANNGSAKLVSLHVWQLRSIWGRR
jgi:fructan beta-fructosidase